MSDEYISRDGNFLNGTSFSKSMHAYQCGSCIKLFTYEDIAPQKANPEGMTALEHGGDRIWLCPHIDCKKPIAKGDILI